VGVVPFIDFLRDAGVDTLTEYSRYGLSLSLGGGEVTMVDMAEAYSVLANNGVRVDLTPFHRVLTVQGKEIVIPELSKTSVLNPDVAYIISDILSDNVARQQAFGPRSYLEIPGYKVAVKTGTTNNKRDNWTIGYTPEYLVVVWVGNNDGTPMNQYLASGVTGAAPIWNRVMKYLITEKSNGISSWYTRPQNVITKTCLGRQELFVKGTENSVPCIILTPKPPIVRNGDTVPTPN
jgi:membrane carboxypeptidase/penicillin-binding protein PbpC